MSLTHCIARERLDTKPKKEASSRSVILSRELFYVFNIMFVKSLCFLSRMISTRLLALISDLNCARTQERAVLKHLYMEIGFRRTCKYVSPRSMRDDSTLHASSGLSCSYISAIRLSSAKMTFWVYRYSPSIIKH